MTLHYFFADNPSEGDDPVPPDAQILGHITWLWLQSPLHQHWPCHLLKTHVLPALRLKQFVLVGNGIHPVGYASWARMSDEAQMRYLNDPSAIKPDDWRSGVHLWWIDWVAPFGHTHVMARHLKNQYFQNDTAKALRVKAGHSVGRVIDCHGDLVPLSVRRQRQAYFLRQFKQMNDVLR